MIPVHDNQNRKRNRDELMDDLGAGGGARKRKRLLSLLSSAIVVFIILIDSRQRNPGVPLFQRAISPQVRDSFSTSNDVEEFAAAVQTFQGSLWARIIALDQYSTDATRKSEQPFWDVYNGPEEVWYKEYRMSRETFNGIVRDSVPFLYTRPTYSLKSANYRYMRAKVVMATLIRYLAIQSNQYTLGKEFGVREPCVSKRLDRGCRALL